MRKNIILILLVIYICLLRIGVFTPTKNQVIKFFNNNKEKFCYVTEFASDNIFDNPEFLLLENGQYKSIFTFQEISSIHNTFGKELSDNIINILIWGNYESIDFSHISKSVTFKISNLSYDPGEAIYIVYSEKNVFDQIEIDDLNGNITYKITYQPLGDNWYYVYREI